MDWTWLPSATTADVIGVLTDHGPDADGLVDALRVRCVHQVRRAAPRELAKEGRALRRWCRGKDARDDRVLFQIRELSRLLDVASETRDDSARQAVLRDRACERIYVHLRQTGETSQADLARALDLDKATVSRSLSRMREVGLIQRRPNPGDRRTFLIEALDADGAPVVPVPTSARLVSYSRELSAMPPATRYLRLSTTP